VFDEARQWRWESDNDEPVAYGDPFIVEYTTEVVQALAPIVATPPPSPIPATPPVGEDVAQAPVDPEFDNDALDANHDDTPLWLWNVNNLVGDVPAPSPARRVLTAMVNFTTVDEPASFKQAKQQGYPGQSNMGGCYTS
jgi:hypothetical protein